MASRDSLLIIVDQNDRLVLTEALMLYAGALDRGELVWLTPRNPVALRNQVDDLLTRLYES